MVRLNAGVGYIDRQGSLVIPPIAGWGHQFSEGLALIRNDEKYFYIDTRGRIAVKPVDNIYRAWDFSHGLARVNIGGGHGGSECDEIFGGKWGFIDKQGKMVIDPQFDAVRPFANGLAVVRIGDDKTGKWGFIDPQGKFVINPQFDDAGSFSGGLAAVYTGDRETGKWGYISR